MKNHRRKGEDLFNAMGSMYVSVNPMSSMY